MTNKKSETKLKDICRTKIIATIGPSISSYETIYELINLGVSGFRLNFAYGSNEERHQQIDWIRKASKELSRPVAIIADLVGTVFRLGDFNGVVEVESGQVLRLRHNSDYSSDYIIPTQIDLSNKVKRGQRVLFNDGRLPATVISVIDGIIHLKADGDGILIKRRSINLPDTDLNSQLITAKDRADLIFASTEQIDYVALGFIQSVDDVREIKRLLSNLNMSARIISKFETKAAVDHMEEIIAESDCVMIDSGKIARELLPEAVPSVQDQIIAAARKYAKPIIIATQMLFSMTTSKEPTRAELSDISNAVNSQVDSLLLSDEAAIGKYPLETVKIMKRTISYTEKHSPRNIVFSEALDDTIKDVISNSITDLACAIDARAIVVETKSGTSAYQLASRRSKKPIIAVSSNKHTTQQLPIIYGVTSFLRPISQTSSDSLSDWLLKDSILTKGDTVVIASCTQPGAIGITDTVKIRVLG